MSDSASVALAIPRPWSPPASSTRTPASLTVTAMLIVVATMFAVSGGLLWMVGLNYDGLQGAGAGKIHPSTYLLIALFGWTALRSGNPVGYLARGGQRRPAALFLLVAALIFFTAIVARGAPGMAGAIDTFVAASLTVLLLSGFDEPAMRRIEILLHALLALNALLGLYEFLSGALVFPYRFDGAVFPNDHRSTALQGHPLTNATVTGVYAVALMSSARLSLPGPIRLPMIGLQFAALVVFGGRTALVTALVIGAALGLVQLHRIMRGGRLPLLGLVAAGLIATLIPLALGGLAAGGFFTALLERFASDGGSAYARIQMFDLFERLPWRDLLVGPDAAYVDSLRRIAGLEWGIENPIIRTLLYQGLVLTLLLTLAVAVFFRELVRVSGPGVMMPLLAFVILINTSESIGGKTTMLSKFAVMLLAFYRVGAGPAVTRRPSDRAPTGSPDRGPASRRP